MAIEVSIIEDDRVTRESLERLISQAEDLSCVRTYASAEEAIRDLPECWPDVLLVDINLPGRSGIECVSVLKEARPGLEMLMLTTYEDADSIFDSLRAGASGYLLKRRPSTELLDAIREVYQGGSPMSVNVARQVVSYFRTQPRAPREMETLSPRENEILSHLARGLHYKEIAEQLTISTHTVRAHLHTIYGKLHVQSRTEAVVKYLAKH